MALLSTYNFEGQTPGATAAASSPWALGTGSTDITVATAAAVHGTVGGRISAASSYRTIAWQEAQTTATRVIDGYFILRAQTANAYLLGMLDGATFRGDVRVNTNGTVSIRNGSTAVGTSAEALALNTLYRFAWKLSTSGQELRVYAGESTTPLFTLTGALTSAQHTDLRAGLTAGSSGFSVDFDTIRIADDWLTPVNPAVPLDTPTGFTFVAHSSMVQIAASWSAVAGAVTYELQVQELVSGVWEDLNTFSGSATSRTLGTAQGLAEGGTYRGRVRALPAA